MTLHKRDLHTKPAQIFGCFQTDKSSARDHGGAGLFRFGVFLDLKRIFDRAEREDIIRVYSVKRRFYRLCPGRNKQLVVTLVKRFAAFEIFDGNGFILFIYGDNLVMNAHIYAKSPVKALGCLQGKISFVLDSAAYIIRQTAICVGNKSRLFKNDNFRPLVEPAYSRRRGRAARNAAYNDYFHLNCHLSFI